MRVKYRDGANRRWYQADICGDHDPVEFDGKGVATVSAELGKAMIKAHPDAFSELKAGGAKKKES